MTYFAECAVVGGSVEAGLARLGRVWQWLGLLLWGVASSLLPPAAERVRTPYLDHATFLNIYYCCQCSRKLSCLHLQLCRMCCTSTWANVRSGSCDARTVLCTLLTPSSALTCSRVKHAGQTRGPVSVAECLHCMQHAETLLHKAVEVEMGSDMMTVMQAALAPC